jgi:hypothetical protein
LVVDLEGSCGGVLGTLLLPTVKELLMQLFHGPAAWVVLYGVLGVMWLAFEMFVRSSETARRAVAQCRERPVLIPVMVVTYLAIAVLWPVHLVHVLIARGGSSS